MYIMETRGFEHLVLLAERIYVARGSSSQHHKAECCRSGWRYPIVIRNKLNDCDPPPGREREANLLEQPNIRFLVEMVAEIRNRHQIVIGAEICLECTSSERMISLTNSCLAWILTRNCQHVGAVESRHLRLRVTPRQSNPVHAVTSHNIQHSC